jgi:hypothetical protein
VWLVDPDRRLAFALALLEPAAEVAYRRGRLGTLSRDPSGITVRLYEVDWPGPRLAASASPDRSAQP